MAIAIAEGTQGSEATAGLCGEWQVMQLIKLPSSSGSPASLLTFIPVGCRVFASIAWQLIHHFPASSFNLGSIGVNGFVCDEV